VAAIVLKMTGGEKPKQLLELLLNGLSLLNGMWIETVFFCHLNNNTTYFGYVVAL